MSDTPKLYNSLTDYLTDLSILIGKDSKLLSSIGKEHPLAVEIDHVYSSIRGVTPFTGTMAIFRYVTCLLETEFQDPEMELLKNKVTQLQSLLKGKQTGDVFESVVHEINTLGLRLLPKYFV